jgi:hypothetical protein
MNSRYKSILIYSVIGILMVAGCGKKDNPTGPQLSSWAGTVSDSTMTITEKNDSQFTMNIPGTNGITGTYITSGKYTINGNMIIFTCTASALSDGGTPNSELDFNPDTGTIAGNQLTIPIPYGDGTKATLTKK